MSFYSVRDEEEYDEKGAAFAVAAATTTTWLVNFNTSNKDGPTYLLSWLLFTMKGYIKDP